MVRTAPMTSPGISLNRRELMTGLGAAALYPFAPSLAAHRAVHHSHCWRGRPACRSGPGGAATPVWSFEGPDLAFRRGETAEITFANELPAPVAINWRGMDGAPAQAPLTARPPLAAGGKAALQLPLRHAGTFLCDAGLLGDGQARPFRARPLIVRETEPVPVDRDEVLLIEEWRLKADGTAIAPGVAPADTQPLHTINGRPSVDLSARVNERIRLRIISGCQRAVVAIKIEGVEVRVMAIDSQPAEPFAARDGALVLAPGGRVDAFVDLTVPAGTTSQILLHDGKEARPIGKITVSQRNAVPPARRCHRLRLCPPTACRSGWTSRAPPGSSFPRRAIRRLGRHRRVSRRPPHPPSAPRAGRTVVLALTNRGAVATVFHLHGHHFRLLDKLDDGWKPFWLDTLAIEPGQTQRIAFRRRICRTLVDRIRSRPIGPRRGWCDGTLSSEEKAMSTSVPAIRSVTARGVVVPLARPLKNAFGVFDSAPLVLIDVETDQGVTGHAYIFAYTKLTLKPLVHLIEEIGRELTGKPVAPYDLMAAMDAKFRLLGWQGLVGMAVSGLDMAYWDALGQVAGQPVVELLGGSRQTDQGL